MLRPTGRQWEWVCPGKWEGAGSRRSAGTGPGGGWCYPQGRSSSWRYLLLLSTTLLCLGPGEGLQAQSLDLGWGGYGLSLGNSKRFSGVRINAMDRGVEEINGLNLTLWNPGPGPDAVYNGIALGLIGTKGRRVNGIALSGIGINARERVRGIAAGLLGVGTEEFTGLAFGGVMVDSKRFFRGINVSGFWTGNAERFEGLAISPGVATASNLRGAAFGGFFAGAEESLKGLVVGGGGAFAAQVRGVAIGGFAAGGVDFAGIALSLGGIGGERLDGIMMAGLGMGATERVRGVAIGGLLAVAPEVTGLMAGALNGLYIDRIDLEDFLHFNLANERFTGLSIGVVNYTARLKGVQLGLINYAGNNPRWLRLLPLINVHL